MKKQGVTLLLAGVLLILSVCSLFVGVIDLDVSAVLSGCCNLGEMLVAELKEKYPNVKMGVLNSKAGAAGMGLIVLQLAHMAKDGAAFEKLMRHGEYLREHIVHMIALKDMKWLVLGGRINKLVGAASSALDIRPLIHIDKEGYLKAFGTARGQKRMVKAICDKTLERLKAFPEQLVAICYTYEQETTKQAMAYLKERLPQIRFVLQPVGSVLTAYLGLSVDDPGAVAFAQVSSWSNTQTIPDDSDRFCARLSMVVQPLAPNTVYWMAGAGIDLAEANSPWAGLWLDTLEYRLERQADGSWRCTEAATGGLRAD